MVNKMSRDYFKITKDVLRKIDCKKQLKFKANEDSLHIFCSDKGIAKAAMLGFKVIILNRETICLEDNDTITIISSTDIRLDDNEIRLFGNTHFTSVDLENVDSHEATNMKYLFYGCNKLTAINASKFDTSSATDMSFMFTACKNAQAIDVSHFDTSKVADMAFMFSDCYKIALLDVSSFDTSKVETMSGMFAECKNLKTLDLSSFDTKSVKYMDGTFRNVRLSELIIGTFDLTASYCNNTVLDIFNGAKIDKLHIKNYIGYEDISDILIDAGISKEVIIDNAAIQSPLPEKTTKTTIFSWDNLE